MIWFSPFLVVVIAVSIGSNMSAESMLPWGQDGKLPPTEDLRDIVMGAGTDPYAHKGIQETNKPYLRPEVLVIKK